MTSQGPKQRLILCCRSRWEGSITPRLTGRAAPTRRRPTVRTPNEPRPRKRKGIEKMADIFPDIGERLFGRPHLIEPAALQARMNSASWRRVLTGEKSDGGAREVSIRKLRNKRLAAIEADRVKVAGSAAEYAIT